MQDAPRTSIASIRAEIKSRAYSGNTGSRRYRRRPAVVAKQQSPVTTDTQPSSAAAGMFACVCLWTERLTKLWIVAFREICSCSGTNLTNQPVLTYFTYTHVPAAGS